MFAVSSPRTRADACPGVLAPHDAADGALARVRLPGGVVSAVRLRVLAGCAEDLGDGAAHLTSRGNLQLRGLDRDDPRLAERLSAAGLLPSETHERVRNILASPLSGVDGGVADLRGLAAELDERLCAVPALAGLPGRFLFALDDGRGDVAAEQPDLCWRATGSDQGVLLVAGTPTTVGSALVDAPALLVAAAEVFLTLRAEDRGSTGCAGAWRAAELPQAPGRIAAALTSGGDAFAQRPAVLRNVDHEAAITRPGRARVSAGHPLTVAPVLGEVSSAQLRALAACATEVVVTPWRSIVLPEPGPGAAQRLRAAGLVTEPDDPALRISACAGRPGCAKSHADVRTDVRELLASGQADPPRAHVVGCERRCGAPHEPHLDVVAQPDGTYRVADRSVPDLTTALKENA